MPLELLPLEERTRILKPGDRGFIVRCKPRWYHQMKARAPKFLKCFTQRYFEFKCPEEAAAFKEAEMETNEPAKEEKMEEADGGTEEAKKEANNQQNQEANNQQNQEAEAVDHSGIQFAIRELVYDTIHCFVATNLADPSDFIHFVFNKLAATRKEKKPKFPMRFIPVQTVCEARPKAAERAVLPLVEGLVSEDPTYPYRFSLMHKKTMVGNWLNRKELCRTIRSVIWSINPYCVPCVKHEDFAVALEIADPLLCIGIAKEFFRLGNYHTSTAAMGAKVVLTDSEDDISDDPTLDIEENSRMILRIKRKRRAESAGAKLKKNRKEGDDEEDEGDEDAEEEEEEDGNAEDNGDA